MTEPDSGPRTRTGSSPRRLWSGGERPYDPEDLVRATGADVTPERVEKARKLIEEEGPSVIERYLP
ncbi:hypothetical protein [Streptomyces sp. CRN 30]|uniref:hypothetical protein n=1 Tax=Streptomyces sp. CRN 30 TaxID=3075613 RepID=UPI002A80AB03|nr:hypothetical protein [Streptomyces sp. CRN 30]